MDLMAGVVYAVVGPNLFSVSVLGEMTQVGTGISGGNGFVRMSNNGSCLVILIPGTRIAYTYTTANGLAPIGATGFTDLGAIDIGFIDTYIVFLQQNGLGFFNDDGKAVSGTGPITFTTATQFLREFGTDLFTAMGIDHRAITMLGTNTGEIYIDSGNTVGSPFSAAPDGFIQMGCGASYSVGAQDESLFWLATDKTIRRRSGQTPIRVSNHGIESILNTATFAGAYALTYSYNGHLFYALTIPAIARTVALDVTTGEWHELSSFGIGYWRPLCALQAYGKQLVGDSLSGKIGFLDTTASTEFGSPQQVAWTHQAVYKANARMSHRRLELLVGAGFAPAYPDIFSSAVSNPLVTLKISDDGGLTYRTMAMKSLGLKGKYLNRVVWTNLGTSRQRVYRFEISDALIATWVPDVLLDVVPGRF